MTAWTLFLLWRKWSEMEVWTIATLRQAFLNAPTKNLHTLWFIKVILNFMKFIFFCLCRKRCSIFNPRDQTSAVFNYKNCKPILIPGGKEKVNYHENNTRKILAVFRCRHRYFGALFSSVTKTMGWRELPITSFVSKAGRNGSVDRSYFEIGLHEDVEKGVTLFAIIQNYFKFYLN